MKFASGTAQVSFCLLLQPVDDADKAIEFYQKALNAESGVREDALGQIEWAR